MSVLRGAGQVGPVGGGHCFGRVADGSMSADHGFSLWCSCSSAQAEESPLGGPYAELEAGSPPPTCQEHPEAASGFSSHLKAALLPCDPSIPATKEVSENVAAVPVKSPATCASPGEPDRATFEASQLLPVGDPGGTTEEQSRASPDMASPQRPSAPGTTAGELSPAPSARSEADCAHELLVYINRDTGTAAETPLHSSGACTEGQPAAPTDKATEIPTEGGSAPNPCEGGAESKAGHRAQDPSPVKEKISSLRKVDRGHYRNRRDGSSSGERARESRSKTEDHYHKKRHMSVRERAKQECHRREHCSGGHGDRGSPGDRRSLGRYSHQLCRSRGGSDQEWSRHHHSESEHAWGREKYYPDQVRWGKCRHYHSRSTLYLPREAREWKAFPGARDYGRPYNDYYKGRKVYEKERHHSSGARASSAHGLPLYPEKYSHEKMALVAEGSCDLSDRFRGPENMKSRKRRHDSVENMDGHGGKPAWRSAPKGPLEEPKAKKHKKSKKKKKSKDKHRARDSR